MLSLDFPITYHADEIFTGIGPSDSADEPSLSARRLEHYLLEEQRHERVPLGVQPLAVNKATVQNYLPEVIQSVDSDAEATVGTMIEPEEEVCWGSFTTLTSTTSDGSSGPIRACNNNNDVDYLAEATEPRPLFPTPSSDQHISPSLARLGKTYVAPIESTHSLAGREFHLIAQDTGEHDLEIENIVRYAHNRSVI